MTLAATFLAFILGITLPTTAHMYVRARKQPLNKKGFALLAAIFLPTYILHHRSPTPTPRRRKPSPILHHHLHRSKRHHRHRQLTNNPKPTPTTTERRSHNNPPQGETQWQT